MLDLAEIALEAAAGAARGLDHDVDSCGIQHELPVLIGGNGAKSRLFEGWGALRGPQRQVIWPRAISWRRPRPWPGPRPANRTIACPAPDRPCRRSWPPAAILSPHPCPRPCPCR